ncbi:hypothetical protein IRY61_04240 [Candidatus Saccharibacteria bacterium]|nr:hypothetical protein [Candidatus Saccharibacteria bacterium]
MADDDRNGRGDGVAKTLATLALILSLIALFWAIKADNRAGDALERARMSGAIVAPAER